MSAAAVKLPKESKEHNPEAKEADQKEKSPKLDKTKQTDIKEKVYTTRQVETSVTLLASPEYDIVLEALLFLSKYADIQQNNLTCLVKVGTVEKLLKIFSKNICILRLSLRLLSSILDCEDGVFEIDQDKYDDKIVDIANMYIEHKDAHVKEFSIEILAKLANSCRITTLIFKVDLFNPIFDALKSSKNPNMLYHSMLLFYELMNAPAAVCALPNFARFDLGSLLTHLNNKDERVSYLSMDVVEKLTGFGLPFLQEGFKKLCLVEKMIRIIMNEDKELQHPKALAIIQNCLNSEETCSYFVESIEFLEMCQWLKTCHPKFLLPLIEVFIKLTSIPELKQMLFDLSVEETIMYFFRFKDKRVLNKTCEAISNMTSHKYCCEAMLTPVIADTLMEILQRQNDEQDSFNENALQTVFYFIRRYVKALDIFLGKNLKNILLDYLYSKSELIKEENFLMVLEILYRCIIHPGYQEEFINEDLLKEIFKLFETQSVYVATLCCEMMSNIVTMDFFRQFFLKNKGAQIYLDVLKKTEDHNLITQIMYFIFTSLPYEELAMSFLRNGLLRDLKGFNQYTITKVPICNRVKNMALNYYLPMKFYETGRLDVTDKLPNKFYLINGEWNGPFPFLELLEMMLVSPYPSIYVVDYSYEVVKGSEIEVKSQISLSLPGSVLSRSGSNSSSATQQSCDVLSSLPEVPSAFDIIYGKISPDVFLPRYIYHLKKFEKYTEGNVQDRIRFLAEYVDTLLCGPKENLTLPQKIHEYKLHIQCLKQKLGNNIIPIGFLRLGFNCERSLLFKALADKICLPCSLVKGSSKMYWNEVALFEKIDGLEKIRFYVVDLINDLGSLMLVGSREANKYCNLN